MHGQWPEPWAKLAKVAPQFAFELISATGLACLRLSPLAGHADHTRITIGHLAEHGASGVKVWLRSEKQATKVLGEIFNWHAGARHNNRGLTVRAETPEAERMIRARAALLGYALIEDAHIESTIAALTTRAGSAIRKMQRHGSLKVLNREYTELKLRMPSPPAYNESLVAKLGAEASRFVDLTKLLAWQAA
jgi:hypothetical protein